MSSPIFFSKLCVCLHPMEKFQLNESVPRVYSIDAPCKINLHLAIGGKRPDGFHEVLSVFTALSLVDTLHFERLARGSADSLEVRWDIGGEGTTPKVDPLFHTEKNLILQALALFRRETGFDASFAIRLDKRIPLGAGLGGGSSDAAATLSALNLLSGSKLSLCDLQEMAQVLGSDVPFFIAINANKGESTALVSGRGETVEPLAMPQVWVLLVSPPFASATAEAFALLDEARASGFSTRKMGMESALSKAALIEALAGDPSTWNFFNDFLPVFLEFAPRSKESGGEEARMKAETYRTVLQSLYGAGALFAGLSGSGSSCFGIFSSKEAAEQAKNALLAAKTAGKVTFVLAQTAFPVLKY